MNREKPWKSVKRRITSETISNTYMECGHAKARAYNAFGPVRGRTHAFCEECGKEAFYGPSYRGERQ